MNEKADDQIIVGHYYALVIGNNSYQYVPRLKTAEDDARDVAAILRDQYGFQTRLLLSATRQQIISALNAYRRELEPNDNLLIYYAGHGYNDRDADKTYWLPIDARRDDNSNWIIADDITSNIRAIPAKHILVVSDSCYSGTIIRGLEPTLTFPIMRQRYLQKMAAGKSRTLMASGGDEPVADEGGGGHSVFASAFLRGLSDEDTGIFTASELFHDYIQESVAGRANQTPEYNPLRNSGHERGDFVFVRKGSAGQIVTGRTSTAPDNTSPDGRNLGLSTQPIDSTAVELSYWNTIKNSTDPADFKAYLQRYPSGQFADLARKRLRASLASTNTASNNQVSKDVLIPLDQDMRVELLNSLSTNESQPGDRFEARVLEPQEYEGATVAGRVKRVRRAGLRIKAEMQISFDRIQLVDGRLGDFNAQVVEVVNSMEKSHSSVKSSNIHLPRGQQLIIRTRSSTRIQ